MTVASYNTLIATAWSFDPAPQVKKMVDMLTARLAEVEKQANAWQKKYQIRTPQEQAQQQAAAAASGGGSTGVLA